MKIDFKAFFEALLIVAILGAGAGIAITYIAPAKAFCGALKKDPQPNHADANCVPY